MCQQSSITILLSLLIITLNAEQDPTLSYDEVAFNWSRSLAEVAQMVGQKHFQLPEKLEDCWTEAINAYLMCLDPHSAFLPPKAYKEITQSISGSFGGIGVVIDNTRQAKDKHLTIIDVIPGGPADKQDIRPLDKIIEIDGSPLEGMTTEEATAKLKGKIDTTVEVKLFRDKHPDILTVTITRDIIKEQNSLCFYLPNQKIYYLSLNMFTQNAIKQIEELLKKSHNHSYKGLVLDLRFNTGGLLNAAIDIIGLFLPNHSLVVQTKGRDNKNTRDYYTQREPIVNNTLPIFILINNYTASAAEILAGCLQQHSIQLSQKDDKNQFMVFLVGTRTFGKGSVQEIVPISNNSAVKLTTALYYLPGDISIQGVGIEPDFEINRMTVQNEQIKWLTKSHGFEKSLPNSIKTEKSKKHLEEEKERDKKKKDEQKQKKWSLRVQESLELDNQFKSTVTLINIIDFIKTTHTQKAINRATILKELQHIFLSDAPFELQEVKSDEQ